MLLFRWNFCHLLHWALTKWQPPVKPDIKNCVKMTIFPFQCLSCVLSQWLYRNILLISQGTKICSWDCSWETYYLPNKILTSWTKTVVTLLGPLFLSWISLTMDSNMPSKFRDEIIHPFPNFKISNSCTVEVWESTSDFTPRFVMNVITYLISPLSIIQYVGLYVFSLPISLVMIEWIYILCLIIIIKSEVWTITHCLGLGHETMVSAVCLSIFFWD